MITDDELAELPADPELAFVSVETLSCQARSRQFANAKTYIKGEPTYRGLPSYCNLQAPWFTAKALQN